MVDRAVPNAPLSHEDAAEHRRLIAQRANTIGYEVGEFTPEFTFATPGDLSVSYTTQNGHYWRIGALLHFSFHLRCTPTFTTAAGEGKVTGFPYLNALDMPTAIYPVRLVGSGVTWPSSSTDIVAFIRAQEDFLSIAYQSSAAAGGNLSAADFSSGSQFTVFCTGFYSI